MFALRTCRHHHGARRVVASSLPTRSASSSSSSSAISIFSLPPQVNHHTHHHHDDCPNYHQIHQNHDRNYADDHHEESAVSLFIPALEKQPNCFSLLHSYAKAAKLSAFSMVGEIMMSMIFLPSSSSSSSSSWHRSDTAISRAATVSPVEHASSSIIDSFSTSFWETAFSSSFIWQMSSTLKKRRTKMNKHKLRKRRKKERRKTKKH
jgi:Mitochondrial domain of unknown function (DUF1713)